MEKAFLLKCCNLERKLKVKRYLDGFEEMFLKTFQQIRIGQQELHTNTVSWFDGNDDIVSREMTTTERLHARCAISEMRGYLRNYLIPQITNR